MAPLCCLLETASSNSFATSDVASCGNSCPEMHTNRFLGTIVECTTNLGGLQLLSNSQSAVFEIQTVSYADGWVIDYIEEEYPSSGIAEDTEVRLTEIDPGYVTVTFPPDPPLTPDPLNPFEYDPITIQFEQNSGGSLDDYTGTYVFKIYATNDGDNDSVERTI